MKMLKNIDAFTLVELMIVVTVMGIMTAFAIPSYTKSIEKSYADDAKENIMTIHAANQNYFAENGKYWPFAAAPDKSLTGINASLRLKIIGNGVTYTCTEGNNGCLVNIGCNNYTCTATRPGGWAFTVTVTQVPISLPNVNPSCVPGGANNPC